MNERDASRKRSQERPQEGRLWGLVGHSEAVAFILGETESGFQGVLSKRVK